MSGGPAARAGVRGGLAGNSGSCGLAPGGVCVWGCRLPLAGGCPPGVPCQGAGVCWGRGRAVACCPLCVRKGLWHVPGWWWWVRRGCGVVPTCLGGDGWTRCHVLGCMRACGVSPGRWAGVRGVSPRAVG